MLTSTKRDLLRGVLWTVAASGGFAVLISIASGAFQGGLLDGVAFTAMVIGSGLLIAVWFVVPIGLCLGLLFPRLVIGKSRVQTLLVGLAVGAAVGTMVAACLKLMMPLSSLHRIGVLSVPYCLIVAVLMAFRVRSVGEVTAS